MVSLFFKLICPRKSGDTTVLYTAVNFTDVRMTIKVGGPSEVAWSKGKTPMSSCHQYTGAKTIT